MKLISKHFNLSFGVIICTYNRQNILERSLQSWDSVHYPPDQFIVVDASDNASINRNLFESKFVKLFSKSDSQYILSDKPGLTFQRNLGIDALKTDIVCFVDDDSFVSPNYVEKILEVFAKDHHQFVGGVNGVAKGQFDNILQKNYRLFRNYLRHNFGSHLQRIHVPKTQTQLFSSLPQNLQGLPLIDIDRLWGANMNYRSSLVKSQRFDENFLRYGLFEDVEFSVRIGKSHKLVCRLDAELSHDNSLGESSRPNDIKYFLSSWLNSAYIIEKLLPYQECRNSHKNYFDLLRAISKLLPNSLQNKKVKTFGNEDLRERAFNYIVSLSQCHDFSMLSERFVDFQNQIYST